MNEQSIQHHVYNRAAVTYQRISTMKGLLLQHFPKAGSNTPSRTNTDDLIRQSLQQVNMKRPGSILIEQGSNTVDVLDDIADYLAWELSAIEAIHHLIGACVLFPIGGNQTNQTTFSLLQKHGGGSSSSCVEFLALQSPNYPNQLMRSHCGSDGYLLSDPDLFLNCLLPWVPNQAVSEALKEAIRCFRAELYMASVVMLGKASEGVWIELGKSLIDSLPEPKRMKKAKDRSTLDNPIDGFGRKLKLIVNMVETGQTEFSQLIKYAEVSLDEFRLANQWSDLLRDTRNVVHYGNEPHLAHNHENVATLLLSGSKHLKALLALQAAAGGK